ncbi:GNAT family N-acetyltransferase [Pendulispora albinea]|uniref:GNAT family N-acetyltransferase n=1 Tax=Pendulispora albinea TaxID=2741071 RepID=A0ABZ2M6U1_9BACT
MMIRLPALILRPWSTGDTEALARLANDHGIWINLRDRFPHPYTHADAEGWIAHASTPQRALHFALETNGELAGGISLDPMSDNERNTAEIGYWLGRPYWNRGLATAAVIAVTEYALEGGGLQRVEAGVYAWNEASARVLTKAGYTLEGRLRRRVVKEGRIGDVLMFARIRDDCADAGSP